MVSILFLPGVCPGAVAKLPADEQEARKKLWAHVAALLKKVEEETNLQPPSQPSEWASPVADAVTAEAALVIEGLQPAQQVAAEQAVELAKGRGHGETSNEDFGERGQAGFGEFQADPEKFGVHSA